VVAGVELELRAPSIVTDTVAFAGIAEPRVIAML
jgi:hypothetical protein